MSGAACGVLFREWAAWLVPLRRETDFLEYEMIYTIGSREGLRMTPYFAIGRDTRGRGRHFALFFAVDLASDCSSFRFLAIFFVINYSVSVFDLMLASLAAARLRSYSPRRLDHGIPNGPRTPPSPLLRSLSNLPTLS